MKEKNLVLLAAKQTELLISVFRKKTIVECPVCFKKFLVLFIQEHAADCASKSIYIYIYIYIYIC